MQLGIPCLTSLDTANALAEIIASRFNQSNTELVDINAMRPWRQQVRFVKMQSCGNDDIFIENFDGAITCPESLYVTFCDRHAGIGADGLVLMEHSDVVQPVHSDEQAGKRGNGSGDDHMAEPGSEEV